MEIPTPQQDAPQERKRLPTEQATEALQKATHKLLESGHEGDEALTHSKAAEILRNIPWELVYKRRGGRAVAVIQTDTIEHLHVPSLFIYGDPAKKRSVISREGVTSVVGISKYPRVSDLLAVLALERDEIGAVSSLLEGNDGSIERTEEDDFAELMTGRQYDVVSRLTEPPKTIAAQLGVSDTTVRSHLGDAYKATKTENVCALAIYAVRTGIIDRSQIQGGRTKGLSKDQKSLIREHVTASYKETAKALNVSESKIRTEWGVILQKTGAGDRRQLALYAIRDGVLPMVDPLEQATTDTAA